MSDKPWRPTGGKDSLLEGRLNTGTWNGKPIFIHITSHDGFTGISSSGKINATPKTDRRGQAAKNGIYLNPVTQTFGPQAAFMLLFFMEEKYRFSASCCFVFSFLTTPGDSFFKRNPLTEGSWVEEVIYLRDITFKEIDILYSGPNPFVQLRHQNHPNPKAHDLMWETPNRPD